MISKDDIAKIVEDYDRMKLRIGMTASHSALDICDGAIEEGFPTVAYCKEGRHKTYANYFKTHRTNSGRVKRGMVDKTIIMPSFNDVMDESMQKEMRKRNVVYIPNRSFTSYSSIDDVENNFHVPLFWVKKYAAYGRKDRRAGLLLDTRKSRPTIPGGNR